MKSQNELRGQKKEKNLIKTIISSAIFIAIMLFLSCFTFAETLNELQQEQAEVEAQEDASEIELELVESELSELQIEIAELNESILELEQEIEELTTTYENLSVSISENQEKLVELTEEYNEKEQLMKERLVALYKAGDTTYLDVLLSSSSITQFISNYYMIEQIVESDTKLINTVAEEKSTLEEITLTLEQEKEAYSTALSDAEKKQVSLSNMQVVKNSYVSQLSDEEKELQEEIAEYQEALQEIEKYISQATVAGAGEDYIGGAMRWPVPGYTTITSDYGMRTHPITGVYKLHTGIDIGAPKGTNFIAVADGVVIQACYNTAYGNMVMIDHGGGVVTLYAHGSSIEVSKGDTVKQGQTVLKVGMTGYATGYHAHFEVRINGEYVDPLDYVSPDY